MGYISLNLEHMGGDLTDYGEYLQLSYFYSFDFLTSILLYLYQYLSAD